MDKEDKRNCMLAILLLTIIIPIGLYLRTLILEFAIEYPQLITEMLPITDSLLIICVGLGLLCIGFYVYLWFEERKKIIIR